MPTAQLKNFVHEENLKLACATAEVKVEKIDTIGVVKIAIVRYKRASDLFEVGKHYADLNNQIVQKVKKENNSSN